jgi:hypothetical protein
MYSKFLVIKTKDEREFTDWLFFNEIDGYPICIKLDNLHIFVQASGWPYQYPIQRLVTLHTENKILLESINVSLIKATFG